MWNNQRCTSCSDSQTPQLPTSHCMEEEGHVNGSNCQNTVAATLAPRGGRRRWASVAAGGPRRHHRRRSSATSETGRPPPIPHFLLGGNITDPLNLNSLLDEEVNRALNAVTPKSSPLPIRSSEPLEILVPRDSSDPLNLMAFQKSGDCSDSPPLSAADSRSRVGKARRRRRNRRRLRDSSEEPGAAKPGAGKSGSGESGTEEMLPIETGTFCKVPVEVRDQGVRSQGIKDREVLERGVSDLSVRGQEAVGFEKINKAMHSRKRFCYGNYNQYYGYRNPGKRQDPRLDLLRAEWFTGRHVLDIGCNVGHVTLTIAKHWKPARCVGLDIDPALVAAAQRNMRHYWQSPEKGSGTKRGRTQHGGRGRGKKFACGNAEQAHEWKDEDAALSREKTLKAEGGGGEWGISGHNGDKEGVMPRPGCDVENRHCADDQDENLLFKGEDSVCQVECLQKCPAVEVEAKCTIEGPSSTKRAPNEPEALAVTSTFPENVTFIQANYVPRSEDQLRWQRAEFDTILCLSVTKWVHLNWGDDGLKLMFRRVYQHLRPGGVFILEAQPFQAYRRRRKISETTMRNFNEMKFYPEAFTSYLLSSAVGFSSMEMLGISPNSSSGFHRPIEVFFKAPVPNTSPVNSPPSPKRRREESE
uniref:7SK snRNA methylphosphate capping enzyme-like n=1 Tax=Myxine glutinosa TaxID=7769 RepID=UPI00358F38C7